MRERQKLQKAGRERKIEREVGPAFPKHMGVHQHCPIGLESGGRF